MKILKIKEKNTLEFNSGFEIDYLDKDGNKKTWELVSRGNLESVKAQILDGKIISSGPAIVATDELGERLCVIKQFRVSAGKYMYEIPAGLMDEGESIEDAAVREFFEETGMKLDITKISPARYTSVGIIDERCSMVYGIYSGKPSKDYLESSEDISVELADRDRIRKILDTEDVSLRAALEMEKFLNLNNDF